MEDEENKRAKKRMAVRIMLPEDQHPRIMEYFRRNLGEPDRMIFMKNSVYVEVVRDTAGGRLLRFNNVEWRHGDKLRMQIPRADMSLGSIVQYVSEEWKLNSKNEANIQDGHSRGNHDRWESSELSANSECTRCSAPGRSSSPASSSSHSHASCVGAGNGPWCTCKWAAPTQGSSGQTSARQFKKQPDTSRPGMRRCGSPRDAPPAPNGRLFSAPGWCSRQQ